MPRVRGSRLVNLLAEIRNDIEGAKLLADWIGDGGMPVDHEHAERRAQMCAFGDDGFACPMNVEPNWWDRIKSQIANTIKSELEIKNALELRVASENVLHMCKCCGCAMPLKVWVPIKHIKEHTTPGQFEAAPSWCWIRRELESPEL